MNQKDSFSLKMNVKATFEDVKTHKKTVIETHNVTATVGKNSIAARLVGGVDKGEITYMALGTGSTTPDASDTALATELIRKQVSVRSVSGNVATFRTFFSTSEGNGTLTEVGLFGDNASSTADSGVLYARAAISKTKTSSETLTLDWSATVG